MLLNAENGVVTTCDPRGFAQSTDAWLPEYATGPIPRSNRRWPRSNVRGTVAGGAVDGGRGRTVRIESASAAKVESLLTPNSSPMHITQATSPR
jgi:hypothetical protein